jgi:hypothetical protein
MGRPGIPVGKTNKGAQMLPGSLDRIYVNNFVCAATQVQASVSTETCFSGEKFPNGTSETVKATPFQRIRKYFCAQETT